MPSAIPALRMCCQRRVAAEPCWRMRDRQRRKFRSSSWPRQYRHADPVLFNPSIGRHDLARGAMAAVAELSHADILPDALLAPDPVPGLRDNAAVYLPIES